MVHEGQCLALGLEAGQDGLGVHAGLDELEGDLAADRLRLLGYPDSAHAAFADFLQEPVAAGDQRADLFMPQAQRVAALPSFSRARRRLSFVWRLDEEAI